MFAGPFGMCIFKRQISINRNLLRTLAGITAGVFVVKNNYGKTPCIFLQTPKNVSF